MSKLTAVVVVKSGWCTCTQVSIFLQTDISIVIPNNNNRRTGAGRLLIEIQLNHSFADEPDLFSQEPEGVNSIFRRKDSDLTAKPKQLLESTAGTSCAHLPSLRPLFSSCQAVDQSNRSSMSSIRQSIIKSDGFPAQRVSN